MPKHFQHNKDERTRFFRKIYLSFYWECCVWEMSWRLNKDCNILTPPPAHPGHSSVSFSFSWTAQTGDLGAPRLSWELVSTARTGTLSSKLWTLTDSNFHRVILLFYAHSIKTVVSQGYPQTSSNGCTCYLHRRIFYFDSLAVSKANMQHTLTNTWTHSHTHTNTRICMYVYIFMISGCRLW